MLLARCQQRAHYRSEGPFCLIFSSFKAQEPIKSKKMNRLITSSRRLGSSMPRLLTSMRSMSALAAEDKQHVATVAFGDGIGPEACWNLRESESERESRVT